MNELTFSELNLLPEMQHAIEELGFEQTTDIQAEAIPLLRTGVDVIGRSQTGTGKTLAFAIPAIERIDRTEAEPTPQVLILCPTRELAQQGCEEIKKLTRFMRDVWPADVYGGASMERQILRLRRCNLVIGTPGRVMDHMRRGTLSLANIKMIILDEADEMLSMGFREDIETILKDVPEDRQTVLFSATMPDAILELTRQFQRDPQMIQINAEQITLDQIRQMYVEVPMGRKLDALILLLRAYDPQRCMMFVNTKLMADEVAAHLNKNGFTCEAIHGDMNQSQRTRVMEGFKAARLPILVATDVAARGIDVSDVDYVINYDVPQNSEYYVHRIGRTGRAGKEGSAITICSGRRQYFQIRDIAREIKSEIAAIPIPTIAEIREKMDAKNLARVQNAILGGVSDRHLKLVNELMERGYDLTMVAAAAFDLCFARDDSALQDIAVERKSAANGLYRKLMLNVGRRQKVAPNHIVSAIAERTCIRGSQIGKIEIYDDKTVVGIPADLAEEVARSMEGAKICGIPVLVYLTAEKPTPSPRPQDRRGARAEDRRPVRRDKRSFEDSHADTDGAPRRGRGKLSPDAKARLLDGSNLSRYEIGAKRSEHSDHRDPHDFRSKRNHDNRRGNRRPSQRKHHA
ncbi:MAG: DEAD/DEAH box helicase [Candidatus Faecivicinus sp.]